MATSPDARYSRETGIRRGLLVAAALIHIGIAWSLFDAGVFGPWITACGVILLAIGLHRFGRLGTT